mmetsp:Transcript_28494/g.25366  ORF Transcript_28494/g.25366 Transcript_28494/m.25366 type:complete len:125 (+) Transcript_28494:146-520(+)
MHSETYEYYLILYQINRALHEKKKDILKDLEKRINDMKKKYGENQTYNSLYAKYLLVKLELEEKDSKKNEIVDLLNKKFLSVKKDYTEIKKPEVKQVTEKKEEAKKKDVVQEEYKPYTDIPYAF